MIDVARLLGAIQRGKPKAAEELLRALLGADVGEIANLTAILTSI